MTDMPQMVALYNGMGGGSAAAIGAGELLQGTGTGRQAAARRRTSTKLVLAVVGALIGAVSLSGSVIAWAKLDGRMDKRFTFPGQQIFQLLSSSPDGACWRHALVFSTMSRRGSSCSSCWRWLFGVLMTLPIGGADMPVVISLYNAFTGLAVAFEGYVLQIEALIIAGTVVGAAGMLLTQLMAKAMNRPISGVLFSNFGGGGRGAGDHRLRRSRSKPATRHR
jgi:NAD(P) transhydrogenase subunit beta